MLARAALANWYLQENPSPLRAERVVPSHHGRVIHQGMEKREAESFLPSRVCCNLSGSSVHGILQARILELFAIPFSRGSSQPGDQTWVSCIAARFFTIWATGETLISRKRHCLADIVLASAICSMSGSHSASFPKLRERYHCNLLSAWSPAVSGVVPLPWAPELKWEWVRYLTKKK